MVRVTGQQSVGHCKFLGTFSGSSNLGAQEAREANARVEALNSAGKAGATHLVWDNSGAGFFTKASGAAYRCSAKKSVQAAPTQPTEEPALKKKILVKSYGSCFAISEKGLLLTNHHVIAWREEGLSIRFAGGEQVHTARVVGVSEDNDLALLKVDGLTVEYLPLSSSSRARLGSEVFTIGYPDPQNLGFSPKYADGKVGGMKGLNKSELLQISVPIQPGNSGGALVDLTGNVVGVVVARASESYFIKNAGYLPQGVNFAIKSDFALALVNALGVDYSILPLALTREEAVKRATRASCLVESRGYKTADR